MVYVILYFKVRNFVNSQQSQETEKNRFFGSLSVFKTDNRTENEKTEKIGFLTKTDTEKPKINRNQKRKKR
jgi:hypothetical protein